MVNNEHLQNLAQTKREADTYFPATAVLERQKLVWGAIWAIAASIVIGTATITMWYAGVNAKLTAHHDRIVKNEATGVAFDTRTRADDQTHLAQNLLMQGMQKELDDRKPLIKEHQEMWFLKEHGISNKEDFMAKHGYAAPTGRGEPTPTPQK